MVVCCMLALNGCTNLAVDISTEDPAASACLERYESSERLIARAGVADSQAMRIAGFPFLRVDRFLASFVGSAETGPQKAAWLARAAALDMSARAAELANLPAAGSVENLAACSSRLREAVMSNEPAWQQIRQRARHVPDDYARWKRVVGVYPLAARFVLNGVRRLQKRESVVLDPAPSENTVDYVLADAGPALPAAARRDALGIPLFDDAQTQALLARFAPTFSVSARGEYDAIGRLEREDPRAAPHVDTSRPTVYTRLAFTRMGDHTLVQLVYSVWFPARPRGHFFDLLGGHLDAITWRVTLDTDGQPLAYDTMHNCGCYHMFFPTARLRLKDGDRSSEEPLWVPFTVAMEPGQRLTLHIASGTHYVTGVGDAPTRAHARKLEQVGLDELRSVAGTGGRRSSVYASDGLIRTSRRLERFLLWPMGIASPGAMRQWGHHATAFVGRRHFDEARLLQRYFERR